MEQELKGIIQFLQIAEQLKNTLRSAHTSNGRQESVAEHTWRLCLLAVVLDGHYPQMDFKRLIKMLVIHDLGEIVNGDIPAIEQDPSVDKSEAERLDFQQVVAPLHEEVQQEFLSIYDEYNEAVSPEAKLAKALDKIETLFQHVQGKNPSNFDYGFNLDYGKKFTGLDEITSFLRMEADRQTRKKMSSD